MKPDIIIIGAPRSGTNMLRDVLTSLPGFVTWDCDEINLTWRHGNRDVPHDELTPRHARNEVRDYVRGRFERVRNRVPAATVVEKTCANSLRVEFVHRIKPEARYIFITRDGLDAAASAMQRWHAPFDLSYTLPKVKQAPITDLPHYGVRFLVSRWQRKGGGDHGHGWWGPKLQDWEHLTRTRPLDEVCLAQWRGCVDAAERGLAKVPAEQVYRIGYEHFVSQPQVGLRSLLDFLEEPARYDERAIAGVTATSIGKGRAGFTDAERARLVAVAGQTLERLGYAD